MSPNSGVNPEFDTRRSKFNIKETKGVSWGMGLNSAMVISNFLTQIGQTASVLGLQHAALLASTFFSTIEVRG